MCNCGNNNYKPLVPLSPYRILCVIIFVLCFCTSYNYSKRIRIRREIVDDSVQNYLMNFGYMPKAVDGVFALRTEESVRDAIRDMQEFAGIPATGRLDHDTIKLMKRKRCGLPDKTRQTSGRRKRFTLQGQKWPFTNLTWSLRSRNVGSMDPYEVRVVIQKALNVWAKYSRLTFTEVDSDRADILIYFYRGDHGDNFAFDGKGVILAHAFFPNGGKSIDVHFDGDESWTTQANSDEGTSLFNVAAHEFGHSLGLAHSSIEDALMFPWYKEMKDGFDYELPEDDRIAIQQLYGSRADRVWETIGRPAPPPPRPVTPSPPRRDHYPVRPKHPTKPRPHYPKKPQYPERPQPPRYNPKVPKYPPKFYPTRPPTTRTTTRMTTRMTTTRHVHRNSDKFHNDRRYHVPDKESPKKPPPDTCDTSYDAVAVIRREVFIFKDSYFWRIGETGGLLPGYPAEIMRLWRDLPANLTRVDAVYERPDGKIVFFIGPLYYVYSGHHLERGYPKPLVDLGLPDTLRKVDGAMVWGHNGHSYFYSGSLYWRFDEDQKKVELDYPRDMSMWKGVGTDIDAVFQWKDGKTYFFKGRGFWKFNDLHMRVEHVEQKPSGPFWMGCTNNLEGTGLGQKLPFLGTVVSAGFPSSVLLSSQLFINFSTAISLYLYYYYFYYYF